MWNQDSVVWVGARASVKTEESRGECNQYEGKDQGLWRMDRATPEWECMVSE